MRLKEGDSRTAPTKNLNFGRVAAPVPCTQGMLRLVYSSFGRYCAQG